MPVVCVDIDADIDFGINIGNVVVVLVSLSVSKSPGAEGVVGSLADGLVVSKAGFNVWKLTYADSSLDTVLVVQQTASLVVSVTMVNSINIGVNLDIGFDIQNVIVVVSLGVND